MESITSGMPEYPALLKEIKRFPKELFFIGDIKLLKERCAAIVGSRKTTEYGRSTAFELAGELSRHDVVIVSGMADGIDTCAHQGALRAGGKTVAVLGCGIDMCYPKKNRNVKREIEKKGLVISEYPPGTEPERYNFPQRNRIISGLSEVVFVVQARNNSGALITADLAIEQGRDVCAIPGNINTPFNLGSNKLIKEGAIPVITMGDALDAMHLGGIRCGSGKNGEIALGEKERSIYELLEKHGEMTLDDLCIIMEEQPSNISGIVTVMELKGVVFSELGKIFIAKH